MGSYAYSNAYLTFTVDIDTTYSIAGSYSFSDLNGSIPPSEKVYFQAWLYDSNDNVSLFSSLQETSAADDGTYYLGGTSGSSNYLQGSLNGTLRAGHTYEFGFQAFLQNHPADGNYPVYYGSGSATLSIVPLPPSALMGLTLLSGLGLAKILKRRRQKALA